MSLFIQTIQTKTVKQNTLTESFTDTIESFITYAERKLTGYSVGEVDHLAKKAKSVASEVDKRDVLSRIDAALKDARADLPAAKPEKQKELRLQIQVLNELRSKVNSFHVVNDNGNSSSESRDKINLDDR